MRILWTFLIMINYAFAGYVVKQNIKNGQKNVIGIEEIKIDSDEVFYLKSIKENISEVDPTQNIQYQEVYYPKHLLPKSLAQYTLLKNAIVSWPGSEVRTLVKDGSDSNRITITILAIL